jgi:hypothetical protein
MKPQKNDRIISDMIDRHEKFRHKMPARELIDPFDWELDFSANEDWVTWEREFNRYGW